MIEDLKAEVHGQRTTMGRHEVAVRFANNKVIRFYTDEEDWTVGEPVMVKLVRP